MGLTLSLTRPQNGTLQFGLISYLVRHTMKTCSSLFLLALFPAVAWSSTVNIGVKPQNATQAIASFSASALPLNSIFFGGFFIMYDFSAADVTVAQISDQAGGIVVSGASGTILSKDESDGKVLLTASEPEPAFVTAAQPSNAGVFEDNFVNVVPEPASLTLAALALLVLTWSPLGKTPASSVTQPRSSRRKLVPSRLIGSSSRNSTLLGRL